MATQVREDEPGAITYSVEGLRRLIELNPRPDKLRAIHNAKIVFTGSKIIDSTLQEDNNGNH